MPIPEVDYTWTFTSTGIGTRIEGLTVREWQFHAECPSGSTAAFEMQAARSTASTCAGIVQGSSQAITSSGGDGVILGFSGPYAAISPRCISITVGGTLIVRAVGN